jgi:hypothetical protein
MDTIKDAHRSNRPGDARTGDMVGASTMDYGMSPRSWLTPSGRPGIGDYDGSGKREDSVLQSAFSKCSWAPLLPIEYAASTMACRPSPASIPHKGAVHKEVVGRPQPSNNSRLSAGDTAGAQVN